MRFRKIRKQETHHRVINGRTEEVKQDVWVRAPSAPFDWDQAARSVIRIAVVFVVLVTIGWSAFAIGDTLDRVAPAGVAYMVAAVFDLGYVVCTLLEWTSRYESDKTWFPRTAGWAAVTVSMAMIVLHSGLEGDAASIHLPWAGQFDTKWIIGGFGALVCLCSKVMLTAVIRQMSGDLDPITEKALRQRRAELQADLAAASYLREELRVTAQLKRQQFLMGLPEGQVGHPRLLALTAGDTPPAPLGTPETAGEGTEDTPPVPRGAPPKTAGARGEIRNYLVQLLKEAPNIERKDAHTLVVLKFGIVPSDDAFKKTWYRARKDVEQV